MKISDEGHNSFETDVNLALDSALLCIRHFLIYVIGALNSQVIQSRGEKYYKKAKNNGG